MVDRVVTDQPGSIRVQHVQPPRDKALKIKGLLTTMIPSGLKAGVDNLE